MKKILVIVMVMLLAVASALLGGCGGKQDTGQGDKKAEVKPVNWKMSVTTNDSSSWTMGAKKFADLAKERSGGRINIQVFPNEQLSGGNQPKGIEMVKSGATEVDIHSTMIWSVVEPKMAAISLPWMFPDYAAIDKAMSGKPGQMLAQSLEAKGVKALAYGDNGFRELTTGKNPVKAPEDLKGMKIRIPSINILISVFKKFGADPTVMNFAEVFTALQQGTIDGQENPVNVIDSAKLYEVQKYMTKWDYCYDAIVLSINKQVWDGLDAETQKILQSAANDAMAYQRQMNRDQEKDFFSKMEQKGMTIIKLTPEEREAFRKLALPVYQEQEQTIGKDLIETLQAVS